MLSIKSCHAKYNAHIKIEKRQCLIINNRMGVYYTTYLVLCKCRPYNGTVCKHLTPNIIRRVIVASIDPILEEHEKLAGCVSYGTFMTWFTNQPKSEKVIVSTEFAELMQNDYNFTLQFEEYTHYTFDIETEPLCVRVLIKPTSCE